MDNNGTSLGAIKIINFGFCLILVFSLFLYSISSGVEQGTDLKNLLTIIFPLAFFAVIGLWLSLPLYIKKNFEGTVVSGGYAALWGYLLSFLRICSPSKS